VAVLDQILAALTPEDAASVYDTALDLRSWLRRADDAGAVVGDFIELRALIGNRHYLACYRLRRWLESHIVAHVTLDRRDAPRVVSVRLDAPNLAMLRARCVDAATAGAPATTHPRVHFAFGTTE
jgi:hypothetical protein